MILLQAKELEQYIYIIGLVFLISVLIIGFVAFI